MWIAAERKKHDEKQRGLFWKTRIEERCYSRVAIDFYSCNWSNVLF